MYKKIIYWWEIIFDEYNTKLISTICIFIVLIITTYNQELPNEKKYISLLFFCGFLIEQTISCLVIYNMIIEYPLNVCVIVSILAVFTLSVSS